MLFRSNNLFLKKQAVIGYIFIIFVIIGVNYSIIPNNHHSERNYESPIIDVAENWISNLPIGNLPTKTTQNPKNIVIDNNWAYFAANFWWCSGSGTYDDPYTIADIKTKYISISNTNEYFIIENVEIKNNKKNDGISLYNVTNGKIQNNEISNSLRALRFLSSSNISTLSNQILNNKYGVILQDSNTLIFISNTIQNSEFNGFKTSNVNDTLIENNDICLSSDSGITIFNSNEIKIYLNRIYDNDFFNCYVLF